MSFGTGPPAPPPLRKSRWSWWKPVKGTSATDDYYYNVYSDNDSRPGSRSGSRSSSRPGSRKGRSSLSVLDDRRTDAFRKDVFEATMTSDAPVKSTAARTRTTVTRIPDGNDKAENPPEGVESKNNRKSTSRPPPAWYNRPYHQRYFSASAVLQRTGPALNDDGAVLRSLPHDQQMGPLSLRSSMAMRAPDETVVLASRGEGNAGISKSTFYPPANQAFAIRFDTPAKENAIRDKKERAALKAPTMDPMITVEAMPIRGSRPSLDSRSRRSSSSTTTSFSTAFSSRDSLESRGRASSWSSQTSFESTASSPPKAVGPGRLSYSNYQIQLQGHNQSQNGAWRQMQRPAPIKTLRRKVKPGELFAALPGEVLEVILEELKKLHLQPGSSSCATCWLRDCCSVALSSRKWLKFARVSLYEDIQLVGVEGPLLKKRYKINHSARMVLLRRTLRNAPHIAVMVRSLKAPSLLPQGVSLEEYHDLVASVVMACPNFERLVGFYPSYNHGFSRLFHALSTRQRLKEMNWIIEPSPYQRQHRVQPSSNTNLIAPGDLQPQQSQAFLQHHVNWSQLTSLTVHCRPGAALTPDSLLTDVLRCLPTLQNLHLSHLPYTAFNDANLLSLPPLRKLTLSYLPGITTAGLSSFATRRSSRSITSLTLIHININSLPALARIFSNLTSLATFSLVQSYPPVMPTDEFIMLFPYLASPSLQKLHWDIPYLPTRASAADTILSRSISAGGFPSLRTLRAPDDPEGIFQSLCRPRERVDCPADRYRYTSARPNSSSGSAFSNYSTTPNTQHSRTGSRGSSFGGGKTPPASPGFAPPADAVMFLPRENSDLRAARVAAQGRLESARRFPRYFVNVIDEQGTVVEKYGVGGFIGTVESQIHYSLLPDAGATDEGGGLVGVGEMLGDNGEEVGPVGVEGRRGSVGMLGRKDRRDRSRSRDRGDSDAAVVREGCTGRWNAGEMERKDKERWSHAERGRWRGVVLS